MTLPEAIKILSEHQNWRIGKSGSYLHKPSEITQAIDLILEEVSKEDFKQFVTQVGKLQVKMDKPTALKILKEHQMWLAGNNPMYTLSAGVVSLALRVLLDEENTPSKNFSNKDELSDFIQCNIPLVTKIVYQKMMSADGHAIDGDDMHWTVICPTCERKLEYTGYFDSGETNKCNCGSEFKTRRVYFDNGSYME